MLSLEEENSSAMLTVQILARDEELTLAKAIDTARELGAEVVVGVDQNSSDATGAIAERLADKVVELDFLGRCGGSFAEAHNQLGQVGGGRWRMKLDGHEYLNEGCGPLLLEAVRRCEAKQLRGIAVRLETDEAEGGIHAMVLRLWKPGPGVRWVRPIHETIDGLGREVLGAPEVRLLHRRGASHIGQRKRQRLTHDVEMLERMLAEDPEDGVTSWNLGCLLVHRDERVRALDFMERAWTSALARKAKRSHLADIGLGIARTLHELGRPDLAADWLLRVEAIFWNVPEVWTLRGQLAEEAGDPQRARFCFRAALMVNCVPLELPVAVRHHTWLPHLRLGRLELSEGHLDLAMKHFAQALRFPLPDEVVNELAPWRALIARQE
ncbi:MAG: hypothetical protein H6741_18175 [Alphaproteobacteria bacterium]|nr:hypothetical protein [Alphaproteobacteria bacterium]